MLGRIALLAFVLTAAGSLAFAQIVAVRIQAPANRVVTPGDYVTVVFNLASDMNVTVDLTVNEPQGWTLVREPGSIDLVAGSITPVPVTVHVPLAAVAGRDYRLTLQVESGIQTYSAGVQLRPKSLQNLSISGPDTAMVSDEPLQFQVMNNGNVQEVLTITITSVSSVVLHESTTLSPGTSKVIELDKAAPGQYHLAVSSQSGAKVGKYFTIRGYGVPAPPRLQVHAVSTAGIDSAGDWSANLTLAGRLSDYVTLDADLVGNAFAQSYLALGDVAPSPEWSVRIGRLANDPFGLPMPGAVGVRAQFNVPALNTTATLGETDAMQLLAAAAARVTMQPFAVTASAGIAGTSMLGSFGVQWQHQRTSAGMLLSKSTEGVDVQGFATSLRSADKAIWTVGLDGINVLDPSGTWALQTDLSRGDERFFGYVAGQPGTGGISSWTAGDVTSIPSAIPGTLDFTVQVAIPESSAVLGYQAALSSNWTSRSKVGLALSQGNVGIRLATAWMYSTLGAAYLAVGGDATWFPGPNQLAGQINAQAQQQFGPFLAYADSGWDIASGTVDAEGGIHFEAGPTAATVGATVQHTPAGWTVSASISGSYAFDLPVPAAITAATGGRNVGRLVGRVGTPTTGIAGINIDIGSYIVRTDTQGRFDVRLPPGDYPVVLDSASLPIRYGLEGDASRRLTVKVHTITRVDFKLQQFAALDVTLNGPAADVGRVAQSARAIVRDSTGLDHTGQFMTSGQAVVRGLAGGPAVVTVSGLPDTETIAQDLPLRVQLKAGDVQQLSLTVKSVRSTATVFNQGGIHIRRVTVSPARAPNGAVPTVTVTTSQVAERVVARLGTQTVTFDGKGTLWSGRIPIPASAPEGPTQIQITAFGRHGVAHRSALLVVSKNAPIGEVTVPRAAPPGGTIEVDVVVYAAPANVHVDILGVGVAAASQRPDGSWVARIPVPASTKPGIYSVRATFLDADEIGRALVAGARVSAP